MTQVQYSPRALRQFYQLLPPLRRAIIRAVQHLRDDAPIFPFRDSRMLYYVEIRAKETGWYLLLRWDDDTLRILQIRHRQDDQGEDGDPLAALVAVVLRLSTSALRELEDIDLQELADEIADELARRTKGTKAAAGGHS